MAMATIGALRVVLGADTAKFDKSLGRASTRMKRFGATMARLGAAAATAVAAAGTGVALAMRGVLNDADQIAKTADKIGLGVEELQKLRHAAELSGVQTNNLDMAMQRFSRRLGEAAQGSGELMKTVEQYNVQLRDSDGRMRTNSAVLADFAEIIRNAESDQERLRIAFKLFDSEGAALVNMLRQGKDGLNAMMTEADQLGFVINEKTARAAENFNDNLTRLGRIWDGLITQVTAQLAPALARLSDILVQSAMDTSLFKSVVGGLTDFLKGTIRVIATLVLFFRRLGAELSAVGQAFKMFGEGEFSAGMALIRNAGAETEKQFENLRLKMDEIFNASDLGDKIQRNIVKPLNTGVAGIAAAGQKAEESVSKATTEASESGQNLGARFSQVGSTMASAMTGVVTGTQKAGDAIKGLGQQLAQMAVQKGFQMLLNFLLPGSGAAAGALGGGGLFSGIGSIFGFAHGGSFTMGGAPGMDNNLVAMNLTRGERVTVDTPGQQGGGGGQPVVNNIYLPRERQTWGRRDLENIVEGLNQVARDGWVVRVQQA